MAMVVAAAACAALAQALILGVPWARERRRAQGAPARQRGRLRWRGIGRRHPVRARPGLAWLVRAGGPTLVQVAVTPAPADGHAPPARAATAQ